MPEGSVANWVVGNHDQNRLTSRIPDLKDKEVVLKRVQNNWSRHEPSHDRLGMGGHTYPHRDLNILEKFFLKAI